MTMKEVLDEAMQLKPDERLGLIEILIQSLDEPDPRLNKIWAEEAQRRLAAYREGRLKEMPMEEVFKDGQ